MGLIKVLTIKIDRRCVQKPTKIKVSQKAVDDLNRKIRKDIEEVNEMKIAGEEIAAKQIMK